MGGGRGLRVYAERFFLTRRASRKFVPEWMKRTGIVFGTVKVYGWYTIEIRQEDAGEKQSLFPFIFFKVYLGFWLNGSYTKSSR